LICIARRITLGRFGDVVDRLEVETSFVDTSQRTTIRVLLAVTILFILAITSLADAHRCGA
tara:strand:- start:13037 stop:13219 length:183 start_codon:yes stop_codon:yes gene_type:complete